MSSITQTVAPTALPVDLDEIWSYLRVDSAEDQQQAERLVRRATAYCENYQWAQYITATYAERFDYGFPPCGFRVARNPLISVSSIVYNDSSNASQTLSTSVYTTDIYSVPGRIVLALNQNWPATYRQINDITLTYTAGYGSSHTSVPENIKQAIMLLASHWNDNREATGVAEEVAFSVRALLDLNSFRTFY